MLNFKKQVEKMKFKWLILGAGIASAVAMTSCSDAKKDGEVADSTKTDSTMADTSASVEGISYAIDSTASVISWKGSKVGGDFHNGTIKTQSGTAIVEGGKLIGGEIVIDMDKMTCLDLKDATKNGYLLSHLKGLEAGKEDHFFNVKKYPTAKFVITSVTDSSIVGDLTIKDKTLSYAAPAKVVVSENEVTIDGSLVFDREKFGVSYGTEASQAGELAKLTGKAKKEALNSVIKNDIEIGLKIVAKK
jgi:polyisoprenoid-binding protein YceI